MSQVGIKVELLHTYSITPSFAFRGYIRFSQSYCFTMPKTKKRKQPIVPAVANTSITAQSCRNTIRQYHFLLKQRRKLESAPEPNPTVVEIEHQLSNLGGLERYQQLSTLGQREERGGGTEKVFIQWMKELNVHRRRTDSTKLRCVRSWFLYNHLSFSHC